MKAIGWRKGPEVWFIAGNGTCGIAVAWCSEAKVTVGFGWPPTWGLIAGRRWTFLTFGVVTFGWRRRRLTVPF